MTETDSKLIDLIYAALLGEVSWDVFMDTLANSPGDGKVTLISHDALKNDDYFSHYYRCSKDLIQNYEEYYAGVNPWVPNCVARPEGYAAAGHNIVPRENFINTEYFNDFLVPHDILDGAGISIVKNENRTVMLSVFTDSADPHTTSHIADRLTMLYPHLRRAADYYRRGENQESTLGFGKALFDAVDIGLIVVGEDLRPKTLSDSAISMIRNRKGLSISPVGRLRIDNEAAQKHLGEMLRLGYNGLKTAIYMTENLKLTLVHIVKDRISEFFEGPTAVLLIESVSGTYDLDFFASTFRLTRMENRALKGIVAGKTIDVIAAEASVSRETVRSQIKSLFLKTGVHSQSGLLRLIYTPQSFIRTAPPTQRDG